MISKMNMDWKACWFFVALYWICCVQAFWLFHFHVPTWNNQSHISLSEYNTMVSYNFCTCILFVSLLSIEHSKHISDNLTFSLVYVWPPVMKVWLGSDRQQSIQLTRIWIGQNWAVSFLVEFHCIQLMHWMFQH